LARVRLQNGVVFLAVLAAIGFGIYASNPAYWNTFVHPPSSVTSNVYPTGRAFEVIDPDPSQEPVKTPEELISDGDSIVANTNLLLEKYDLSKLQISADKQREISDRVADIKSKIQELESQLE